MTGSHPDTTPAATPGDRNAPTIDYHPANTLMTDPHCRAGRERTARAARRARHMRQPGGRHPVAQWRAGAARHALSFLAARCTRPNHPAATAQTIPTSPLTASTKGTTMSSS